MFLIKSCPTCQRKLRFPIDKGIIKVHCRCGREFIVDPDSKELYKDAQFDLKTGPKKRKKAFSFRTIVDSIIAQVLNFKYNIQNFRLLPTLQQRKIILIFITFILLFIVVAVIIKKYFLVSGYDDGRFI